MSGKLSTLIIVLYFLPNSGSVKKSQLILAASTMGGGVFPHAYLLLSVALLFGTDR